MATVKANDNTALCSIWAGLAEVESQSCSHLANERAVHSVGTEGPSLPRKPAVPKAVRWPKCSQMHPGIIGCDRASPRLWFWDRGRHRPRESSGQNISHGHRITSYWSKA